MKIGDTLHGYCGGLFGDSYGDKTIEAVGRDWVVVRSERGVPGFFGGDLSELKEYLQPQDPERW